MALSSAGSEAWLCSSLPTIIQDTSTDHPHHLEASLKLDRLFQLSIRSHQSPAQTPSMARKVLHATQPTWVSTSCSPLPTWPSSLFYTWIFSKALSLLWPWVLSAYDSLCLVQFSSRFSESSLTPTPISPHRSRPLRMLPDQLIQNCVPCPILHFALLFTVISLLTSYWIVDVCLSNKVSSCRLELRVPDLSLNFLVLWMYLAQRRSSRKFVQGTKTAPGSYASSLPIVTPKLSPPEMYRGPKGNI